MYQGKYHTETRYKGQRIVIDLCEMGRGFEVMALYTSTGNEIDVANCDNLPDAVKAYDRMIRQYKETPPPACPSGKKEPPAPLSGRYAKLRDDLREALKAGKEAEAAEKNDGGASNFDSAALYLPRWTAAKVQQAAKEAGTVAHVHGSGGGRSFVIAPDSTAQGRKRTVNAKALTAALKAAGYDSRVHYCID